MKMNPSNPNVPYGFCGCGCGQKTVLAEQTRTDREWIKGEPKYYIAGHQPRMQGKPFHEWYEKNPVTECWIWKGGTRGWDGYGSYSEPGTNRAMQAHRWAYIEKNGPIPSHLVLDHRCENRACVNPDHLEAVTQAVNVQRGKLARLKPEQVAYIKGSKKSWRKLAIQYDVGKSTIQSIKQGKTWKNIEAVVPPDELEDD